MEDKVEITAGSLLATSGAYWQGFALQAAVNLSLFDALGDEPRSAEEVASRIGGDLRATSTLLGAVAAMGLVTRDASKWVNSDAARSLLCSDSPQYVGFMILHHHNIAASWLRLDESVRNGAPTRSRASTESSDDEREHFLMGMFNQAMAIAPKWASEIDLSGRRHLLDLGGGPGTWAIHFCLENPDLQATVLDLPTTRPFAEKTVDRFGVSDRVGFLAGDFTSDGYGGPYDVAWLSHVLHSEGPEVCRDMLAKTVAALEPGGFVLVHDFILDDDRTGPLFPALFSLNMLVGTPAGRSYSRSELTSMLESVGAHDVRRASLRGPTGSSVLVAST